MHGSGLVSVRRACGGALLTSGVARSWFLRSSEEFVVGAKLLVGETGCVELTLRGLTTLGLVGSVTWTTGRL